MAATAFSKVLDRMYCVFGNDLTGAESVVFRALVSSSLGIVFIGSCLKYFAYLTAKWAFHSCDLIPNLSDASLVRQMSIDSLDASS